MANYPQDLLETLQEYLTDGVITPKERQVLLNKAISLGVNPDEFDLYIDAQVQKIDKITMSAVKKEQGRLCPFCQSPLPMLADKCPACGADITPKASKEVEEIIDNLEDALENLKIIGAEKAEDSKITFVKFIKMYIKVALIIPLFFSSKKTDDYPKHKAIVERCCRKARMYYGNNKTIQFLIEDTNIEIAKIEKNLQSIKRRNTLIVIAVVIFYLLFCILSALGV